MTHPDWGGEREPLPPLPPGMRAPDVVGASDEEVEDAGQIVRADLEGETFYRASCEVIDLKHDLADMLADVDATYGAADPTRMSFHTLTDKGIHKYVLVTSEWDDEVGAFWNIIVSETKPEDDLLFAEYEEYSLAKDMQLFAFSSQSASTPIPALWTPEALGESALLYGLTDSYVVLRGNESALLVPCEADQPDDASGLQEFAVEMHYLRHILGQFTATTHNSAITHGREY